MPPATCLAACRLPAPAGLPPQIATLTCEPLNGIAFLLRQPKFLAAVPVVVHIRLASVRLVQHPALSHGTHTEATSKLCTAWLAGLTMNSAFVCCCPPMLSGACRRWPTGSGCATRLSVNGTRTTTGRVPPHVGCCSCSSCSFKVVWADHVCSLLGCPHVLPLSPKNATAPAQFVNWTAAGKVTPIKAQGNCGSCWVSSGLVKATRAAGWRPGLLGGIARKWHKCCALPTRAERPYPRGTPAMPRRRMRQWHPWRAAS